MVTPLAKPASMLQPFAKNGTKATIPNTPGATPGAASMDQGFPALTMTPVQSGGVPPRGTDFNGILNWITQHTSWINAGGQYTFDAALVAFIGGYPVGMVLQSNDGLASYVNVLDGNSTDFNTDPSQIGVTWIPYGGSAVSPQSRTTVSSTGGTVTLNALQASRQVIVIQGNLTSALTVIFPIVVKTWLVINATNGAFSVTCKTAAGNGLTVDAGITNTVACDGGSIVFGQNQSQTMTAGDSSTRNANTAFVATAIANALNNTALTGTPTAPTPAANDNSNKLSTTQYTDRAVSNFGAASIPQFKNLAFTALSSGDYWIDTTNGAFVMALPDPPSGANPIRVQDVSGMCSINPLTLNPGTKTILGDSSMKLDIAGGFYELWYNGSDWRLV